MGALRLYVLRKCKRPVTLSIMSVILSVYRPKCEHSQTDMRMFRVFDATTSFNKLQGHLRCHEDGMMEVALSKYEDGPWTRLDDDDDMYDLPLGVLVSQFPGTKFLKLTCIPAENKANEDDEQMYTAVPVNNAFSIMMSAQQPVMQYPDKKTTSAGVKEGLSRKDQMFNDIVDWMKEKKLEFHSQDEGKYLTQSLTNCLWYITNQHCVINDRSRRESSVLSVPVAFDSFEGYNEYKRKKMKAQPLESSQLLAYAQSMYKLCERPIMRSSPAWEVCYEEVKALALCLESYQQYLVHQKQKINDNQKLDHPVRSLNDCTSVYTVKKSINGVKEQYKLIDKALCLADYNEPVYFDEKVHLEKPFEYTMHRFRFFESMQLSVTIDVVKYCPGGGVTTTWCLFKVPDSRTEAEKTSNAASNVLKIKANLPEYHTRAMKQEFKRKVQNVAYIQPSLLDTIYRELTLDASVGSHPATQQRMHMILMGETGLLSDMRKLNPGRPTGTYDVFFSKLGELIEQFTAADDRRHNEAHMSQMLSIHDLIQQTKEKCPEATTIPSSALVRLQFTPRNPYAKTALSFTSKLQVQHKIQRRQLRITHSDDHYTLALFKYLRCLAVSLGSSCYLYFSDDKAKVPFGEPGVALSTGVRGKTSITPTTTTLVATDHDLHKKGSLTPSVYFKCEIPDSIHQSFYRGQVTTIINDSVFQSSNPMRHAAAMIKLIRSDNNSVTEAKTLLKFTDGGTDHRNTLEHVKCAAICIFKELDLDMYIAARCAPGQSWINPAERVMSILNLGLQNCALSREKSSEQIEEILHKCSGMEGIRKANISHPELREGWEESTERVKVVIADRFSRLSLKGEPIKVADPVSDEEIDLLKQHLNHMFPEMNTSHLVKSETHKVPSYLDWIENHCRQRHYCFQIRKCDDRQCCNEPTRELKWLPDPMLQEDGEHFMPFEEVYGKETCENDRPTFQVPKQVETRKKSKQGILNNVNIINEPLVTGADAAIYTAQNARFTAECKECGKHRVLYGKAKLTERYKVQLGLLLSEYDYTCGSPLTPPDHTLHGKLFARLSIDCSSPMETSYYSAIYHQSGITQVDRCFYCGNSGAVIDVELKRSYKTVYPLCSDCKVKGFNACCMRPYGRQK